MGSEIQRVDSTTTNKTCSSLSSSSCASNGTNSPTLPATATPIPELTIFIDEHDVQSGARQVLQLIRPAWKDEHIQFKVS